MIKRKITLFIMVSLAFSIMVAAFFPEQSSSFYAFVIIVFTILYRMMEKWIWGE